MTVQGSNDQFGSLLQPAKRLTGLQAEVILISRIGFGEHGDARAWAEEFFSGTANQEHVHALVHARFQNGGVELLHHLVTVGIWRWIVQFEYRDALSHAGFHQFFSANLR